MNKENALNKISFGDIKGANDTTLKVAFKTIAMELDNRDINTIKVLNGVLKG